MNDEFPSEKEIFLQALDYENAEERLRFLDEACGDDSVLRKGVDSLLGCMADDLLAGDEAQDLAEERSHFCETLASEGRFLEQLGSRELRDFGDYELLEEIGRGAMGVVFRARQKSLNREVALKVVLSSALATDSDRERFRVESESAARLEHTHIVPVYEVGCVNGHDFYSMALLRGGTLAEQMAKSVFTCSQAVAMMQKVTDAVRVAHQQGVVHRDLKPENILLNTSLEPHVADFGLACWIDRESQLTLTGQLIGSPQYIAPELVDGHQGRASTSADIYALGAILYELLAGQPVFRGKTVMGTLQLVKESAVKPLRSLRAEIDRDLETIVHKCLSKQPEARYSSAVSLANDLTAWGEKRPISARPPSPAERALMWVKRRPLHASLIGLAALFLLTLGVGGPLMAVKQKSLRVVAERSDQEAQNSLQLAKEERDKADKARSEAVKAAELAAKQAKANRRLAYSASMRYITLASESNKRGNLAAHTMIGAWKPDTGQQDLRGWEWYFTHGKIHQKSMMYGVGTRVNSLQFSRFGEWILYSSDQGTGVRHTLSSTVVREFRDGTEHEQSRWSHDAEEIATLSTDGSVTVWDAKNGGKVVNITSSEKIESFSWDPKGERVVTLDQGGELILWKISSQAGIAEMKTSQMVGSSLEKIAWSPDGKFLAAVGESSDVFVWGMEKPFSNLTRYQGHTESINDLAWHADSKRLATGSNKGVLRVWGVPGGQRIANSADMAPSPICSIAWNPDGQVLEYASDNEHSMVNASYVTGLTRTKHHSNAFPKVLAWSAESHSFAIGDDKGRIEMVRKGLPLVESVYLKGGPALRSLQWNPEGTHITVFTEEGETQKVNLLTGKSSQLEKWISMGRKSTVVWNSRSSHVLAIDHKGRSKGGNKVQVYHNVDGELIAKDVDTGLRRPVGCDWVNEVDFVVLSDQGRLSYQGTKKAKNPWRFDEPERKSSSRFTKLSVSPDSLHILATGRQSRVTVWDARSGEVLVDVNSPGQKVAEDLHEWHPNSQHFATANGRGEISFWELGETSVSKVIEGHKGPVTSVAWHPEGERIASAGEDGVIRLWDTQNSQLVLSLAGHSGAVSSLKWAPDGRRLASVGKDGTLRVWDATAGMLLDQEL